mmetsp:Transcript_19880/g.39653  ORF Transcript_19880/g.39653 Transcript_19880/m.39653 type:complete len:350 (-) Transcript_19880:170-1219(-)
MSITSITYRPKMMGILLIAVFFFDASALKYKKSNYLESVELKRQLHPDSGKSHSGSSGGGGSSGSSGGSSSSSSGGGSSSSSSGSGSSSSSASARSTDESPSITQNIANTAVDILTTKPNKWTQSDWAVLMSCVTVLGACVLFLMLSIKLLAPSQQDTVFQKNLIDDDIEMNDSMNMSKHAVDQKFNESIGVINFSPQKNENKCSSQKNVKGNEIFDSQKTDIKDRRVTFSSNTFQEHEKENGQGVENFDTEYNKVACIENATHKFDKDESSAQNYEKKKDERIEYLEMDYNEAISSENAEDEASVSSAKRSKCVKMRDGAKDFSSKVKANGKMLIQLSSKFAKKYVEF